MLILSFHTTIEVAEKTASWLFVEKRITLIMRTKSIQTSDTQIQRIPATINFAPKKLSKNTPFFNLV